MLRVCIVTWSTWALLVGSSCTHTACNELGNTASCALQPKAALTFQQGKRYSQV